MEISRVGPKQIRMIEALADGVDSPGHRGALIYIDSGVDGWAIWVDITKPITTIFGEPADLGALVRCLRSIAGSGRREAVRFANRIEAVTIETILVMGHIRTSLALEMLREFQGDETT